MSGIVHQNIKPFFLFNFRDLEKTYAVKAELVKSYIENSSRKSIPVQFCINQGIEINGEKKKVRFRYDLEGLFKYKKGEKEDA